MTTALDRLAARLERLERRALRAKAPQLAHSSVEDGALGVNVSSVAPDGTVTSQTTMQVGLQYDGTAAASVITGPPPPQPSAPAVDPVAGGLKITWDGTFALAGLQDITIVAPMDFKQVDVVISRDASPDFIATPPSSSFLSPRGGEVFLVLDEVATSVALVTRSQAGKASAPSAAVSATPLPVATGGGGGGIKTYTSATAPVGLGAGDEGAIWYDQAHGNLTNRWNGAAWVNLALGSGGITIGGVRQRELNVAAGGGAFVNLVPDPQFRDPNISQARLESIRKYLYPEDMDAWQYKTVANLLPATPSGYTLGPKVVPGSVAIYSSADIPTALDITLQTNAALAVGDMLFSTTIPLPAPTTTSSGGTYKIPVGLNNQSATWKAEYLDGSGAVLLTKTGDSAWNKNAYQSAYYPELLTTTPPAASVNIRFTFYAANANSGPSNGLSYNTCVVWRSPGGKVHPGQGFFEWNVPASGDSTSPTLVSDIPTAPGVQMDLTLDLLTDGDCWTEAGYVAPEAAGVWNSELRAFSALGGGGSYSTEASNSPLPAPPPGATSIKIQLGSYSNCHHIELYSLSLKYAVSVDKADVGLGNVDNTSDASKPISTATQTAIDADRARLDALEAVAPYSYKTVSVDVPLAASVWTAVRTIGTWVDNGGQSGMTYSSPTGWTIAKAGRYAVNLTLSTSGSQTGIRGAGIRVNGTSVKDILGNANTSFQTPVQNSLELRLLANDVLDFFAYSSVACTLRGGSAYGGVTISYIGP